MAKNNDKVWPKLLALGAIGGVAWMITEWSKNKAQETITGAAKTTAKSKLRERITGALT